jgi:hypothetical protein
MENYEKLGAFYLGKEYDEATNRVKDDLVLYDSRDLTTHAVCVGMTGSGKTGLCLSLLEEAAIDGIPAIAIDPKGDLGNLLLTFPEMKAADFQPWVDADEASRQSMSREEYAQKVADDWQKGLASWDQTPDRIRRLRETVELAVYTPGNTAGIPVSALRSFDAPSPRLLTDASMLRERVQTAVSGLLELVGITGDPLRSREHILLSTILNDSWQNGRSPDLTTLINLIQKPPFSKVGVLDLESFYPSRDRFELAIMLNNLIASPGFAAWMEGEPLNTSQFLYTANGKPRLSIFSIAHLNDAERMFFVTLLLNEILSWMRLQPGTSSLRAILYIDEIFGYFPPTANPPSKIPMLTLLKQARAFGLGIVLATQNPVDLDYKGLSNTGTWFIGRLQTERDRNRLIEGLENLEIGIAKDRKHLENLIAGLASRVFLMRNIHEDNPLLFQTRWALSYLRGPLTLPQIQTLMDPVKKLRASGMNIPAPPLKEIPSPPVKSPQEIPHTSGRPVLPPGIDEVLIVPRSSLAQELQWFYRPYALGKARLHFADRRNDIDLWQTELFLAPFSRDGDDLIWNEARLLKEQDVSLISTHPEGSHYDTLPTGATLDQNYRSWKKMLESYFYQHSVYDLRGASSLKLSSRPGESEAEFLSRISLKLREQRDESVDKLRQKYTPKLATLQDKIGRAQDRLEREKSQVTQQSLQTAISMGATVLGAFFGRKITSTGNIGRATTTMRGAGRIAREKEDVQRAQEKLMDLQQKLKELQNQFDQEINSLRFEGGLTQPEIVKIRVKPRKSDILIQWFGLVWTPWIIGSGGGMAPAF